MAIEIHKRLFTTSEYHSMHQAGIFSEDDRIELIEGEILEMAPVGSQHAACVKRLNRLFSRLFRDRALVGVQDPIELSDFTEPEPDLSLLRLRDDFYASGHPRPDDLHLCIEVADASVGYDRSVKVPLYGRSGIREIWLIDLGNSVLEVHQDPSQTGYRSVRRLRRGERIAPQDFADLEIEVDTLFG